MYLPAREVTGGEVLRGVEGLGEEEIVPDGGGAHRGHPPDALGAVRPAPVLAACRSTVRAPMLHAVLQRLNGQRRREARVQDNRGCPPALDVAVVQLQRQRLLPPARHGVPPKRNIAACRGEHGTSRADGCPVGDRKLAQDLQAQIGAAQYLLPVLVHDDMLGMEPIHHGHPAAPSFVSQSLQLWLPAAPKKPSTI